MFFWSSGSELLSDTSQTLNEERAVAFGLLGDMQKGLTGTQRALAEREAEAAELRARCERQEAELARAAEAAKKEQATLTSTRKRLAATERVEEQTRAECETLRADNARLQRMLPLLATTANKSKPPVPKTLLALQLDDVLSLQENPAVELELVKQALGEPERYAALQGVFVHYAGRDPTKSGHSAKHDAHMVSTREFKQFARDCRFVSNGYTAGMLDLALAKTYMHPAERAMDFGEWVAAIVRVASGKYGPLAAGAVGWGGSGGGGGNPPPGEMLHLLERVMAMLDHDVFPRAKTAVEAAVEPEPPQRESPAPVRGREQR